MLQPIVPWQPPKNLRYAQNGGRWSRNICKFFLPIKASPGGLGVALIVGEWQRKGVGILRGWEALASQGKATDKESGMGELLTCPMSLPLPLRWLGMLGLKMSLFILSLAAACPSPGLGGLIFARNFYRAERNSWVTCRTRQSRWGRSSQVAVVGRALGHGASHWQP